MPGVCMFIIHMGSMDVKPSHSPIILMPTGLVDGELGFPSSLTFIKDSQGFPTMRG